MSKCIRTPNFDDIYTQLLLLPVCANGRPPHWNFTFGVDFGKDTRLAMSKSICISNFDEISQSAVKLLLFPVYENGRLPF